VQRLLQLVPVKLSDATVHRLLTVSRIKQSGVCLFPLWLTDVIVIAKI